MAIYILGYMTLVYNFQQFSYQRKSSKFTANVKNYLNLYLLGLNHLHCNICSLVLILAEKDVVFFSFCVGVVVTKRK